MVMMLLFFLRFAHHAVLDANTYHPGVDRISKDETNHGRNAHDAPKEQRCRIAPFRINVFQNENGGQHAGHHHIHGNGFDKDGFDDRFFISFEHGTHKERLKDKESKKVSRASQSIIASNPFGN